MGFYAMDNQSLRVVDQSECSNPIPWEYHKTNRKKNTKWRFPKSWEYPPAIIHFRLGSSTLTHSILGYPILGNLQLVGFQLKNPNFTETKWSKRLNHRRSAALWFLRSKWMQGRLRRCPGGNVWIFVQGRHDIGIIHDTPRESWVTSEWNDPKMKIWRKHEEIHGT